MRKARRPWSGATRSTAPRARSAPVVNDSGESRGGRTAICCSARRQYSYKPTYGYVVTGTLTLSDQIYMRPRQSSSVTRNDIRDAHGSARTTALLIASRHLTSGIGSAVVDLIFSMAKREVTFFSGTAAISFL